MEIQQKGNLVLFLKENNSLFRQGNRCINKLQQHDRCQQTYTRREKTSSAQWYREKAMFSWHLSSFLKDEHFAVQRSQDRDDIPSHQRTYSWSTSQPINLIFPKYLSRIQCGVRWYGNQEEMEDLLLVFRMSTCNEQIKFSTHF